MIQWQTSSNGGSSYAAIPGATSATYSVTAGATTVGKLFRAVFSNSVGSPAHSGSAQVTIAMVPRITKFGPGSGRPGTAVTVSGTNFENATKVQLGSRTVTVTTNSATVIKFKVPAGATSGKITVKTPGGTANSATVFKVT